MIFFIVILSNSNSDGTDAKATFQNSMTVDKWTFQLITSWNRLTLIALLPEYVRQNGCDLGDCTNHHRHHHQRNFAISVALRATKMDEDAKPRDGNGREWIPSDTAYRTLQPRRSEDFGRLVLTSCERLWIEPPTCTI
ncbi:hypothetical protein V1478_005875, partial [Vespula squamosa]